VQSCSTSHHPFIQTPHPANIVYSQQFPTNAKIMIYTYEYGLYETQDEPSRFMIHHSEMKSEAGCF